MQRHFPAFASLTASCFLQAVQGNIWAAAQNLLFPILPYESIIIASSRNKAITRCSFTAPLSFHICDQHISYDGGWWDRFGSFAVFIRTEGDRLTAFRARLRVLFGSGTTTATQRRNKRLLTLQFFLSMFTSGCCSIPDRLLASAVATCPCLQQEEENTKWLHLRSFLLDLSHHFQLLSAFI